jgi:hypothetical protein
MDFLLGPYETPDKYARKLVYTSRIDGGDAQWLEIRALGYPPRKLIFRIWSDGTVDWFVLANGSWPNDEDLIEPYNAACLQIGFYNELLVISASAAIKRLRSAIASLTGRVPEDKRIELANYLRNLNNRKHSDAFVTCRWVSLRVSSLLKDNQPYHDWFVLGQEIGLSMVRRIVGDFGGGYLVASIESKQQLPSDRRSWFWDGFPTWLTETNIQPIVDILPDGWSFFPLPSTKRIEIFLSYYLPNDPLDLFECEAINRPDAYKNAIGPMSRASVTPSLGTAQLPLPECGLDALEAVLQMINGPNPDFTRIGDITRSNLGKWSDDQVRQLLETERLNLTVKSIRQELETVNVRYMPPSEVRARIGGNLQRVRLLLRMLERLGEYRGFGEDKAGRQHRPALDQ